MNDIFKKLIYDIAIEEGLKFEILSKDWIISLSRNNLYKFIVGTKLPLNDQATAAMLADKYATYAVLKSASIPVIEHNIMFNPVSRSEYVGDFISLNFVNQFLLEQPNGQIVIKANKGYCGKEVYRCSNTYEIKATIDLLFEKNDSISICPFYDIEIEYRLVYLNGCCKLIFGKKATNWKHNLANGAVVVDVDDENLKKELMDIADKAIFVTHAKFVTVDIIKTTDNKLMIMEINSIVSLMKFAQDSEKNFNVAKNIYKEAILSMFS